MAEARAPARLGGGRGPAAGPGGHATSRSNVLYTEVEPAMLRWAMERNGYSLDDLPAELRKRFPGWVKGVRRPTLRQADAFAKKCHVPLAFLNFKEPPDERLPIADFRTVAGEGAVRPSPNLLETVYECLRRQDWYQVFAEDVGLPEVAFVGSSSLGDSAEKVAAGMRRTLGFRVAERRRCASEDEAQRRLVSKAEDAGILVMVSSFVRNTHRPLDIEEFRGIAMPDKLAPLVFVNSKDTRAAMTFTLAHELAHIWLGTSAVSDLGVKGGGGGNVRKEERWCNAVAAEFLVPAAEIAGKRDRKAPLTGELVRLAREFKVSTLVVLRRLRDTGQVGDHAYSRSWKSESAKSRGSGGPGFADLYALRIRGVGRRFLEAVVESTLDGSLLHTDAFELLGVKGTGAFEKLGRKAGLLE